MDARDKDVAEGRRVFERIAEVSPDILYVQDLDSGELRYANRQLAAFIGHPRDGRRTPDQLAHPDDLPRLARERRQLRALADGDVLELEFRVRRADGSHRWLRTRSVIFDRDERGAPRQVLRCGQDVTERRSWDEALRRSEARFRLATEAVSGLVYDWDVTSERVDRSRGLYELVGYTAEEAQPTSAWWLARIHPDDRERCARHLERSVASGLRVHEGEYRVVHRDGSERHVWDRAILDRDDEGELTRVIGCAIDVTNVRRAEAALREADRRKDEFLAVLGHELRNPLAPILTATELLRMRGDLGEVGRELDTIERQLRHAITLVDDLLDVSRITRGKLQLARDPVAMAAVVHQAVEAVSTLLETRGHALRLELPDEPVYVVGDAARLVQVVANLLSNAAKYTPAGGALEIGLRPGVVPGELALWVRDDGVGIERDLLARVFEPFVQGARSIERREGGLGVGLAIVRSLVELHGGRVAIESTRGRGTTVHVALPACAPPADLDAVPVEVTERLSPPTGRWRVLLVDDNEDLVDMLGAALSRLGHEVTIVYDGASALHHAASERADIAIVDIGLPVLDGYEVARRLRQLPTFARARLVALTGYGQPSDRDRALAAGFDAHLVKPVTLDTLVECIGRLCAPDDERATAQHG